MVPVIGEGVLKRQKPTSLMLMRVVFAMVFEGHLDKDKIIIQVEVRSNSGKDIIGLGGADVEVPSIKLWCRAFCKKGVS